MLKYAFLLVVPLVVFITTYFNHQEHINQYIKNPNLDTFRDLEPIKRAKIYYYDYRDPETQGNISKLETRIPFYLENEITDVVVGPLNSQLFIEEKVSYALGTYSDILDEIDPRFISLSRLTAFLYKAQRKRLNTHLMINLNSVHMKSRLPKNRQLQYMFRTQEKIPCELEEVYQPNCTFEFAMDFKDENLAVKHYLYQTLNSVWVSKGFNGVILYQGKGYHQDTLLYFRENFIKDRNESVQLNVLFEDTNVNFYQNYLKTGIVDDLILYNYPLYLKNFLDKRLSFEEFQIYLKEAFSINNQKLILPLTRFYQGFETHFENKKALLQSAWIFSIALGAKLFLSSHDEIEGFQKYLDIYKKYYLNFQGFFQAIETNNPNLNCFTKNKVVNDKIEINSLTCINIGESTQELKINKLKETWSNGFRDVLNNKNYTKPTDHIGMILPYEGVILIKN